ncbi:hypothetical protein EHS25_007340 [Saitozyma podzolica]|uniref:Uncharacterized protein n=1 Tax=Saitozyma podzolica TaxID=1890683 RepID=A0A427XME3_9TREE|nr:hypothetical protein EHS25_007340 [Saitozyma podzolica]
MGLFGTSDPVEKQEKMLTKGESQSTWRAPSSPTKPASGTWTMAANAAEEKSIKQAIKDIALAEKNEAKGARAETLAHSAHEKAVEEEAKLSSELHKLQQKHQDAASKVQATAQDISTKADEHQRLAQAVEQRKAHLNQLESQHHDHGAVREHKLRELHAQHKPTVGAAAGTGELHPQ